MLSFCYICKENSIQKKIYTRKKDGARCLFERCINHNPRCQYKHHRILSQEKTHAQKPDDESETGRPQQLELFGPA